MKDIIINDFDLKDEELDKVVYKSRAILKDGDSILVANYRNIYLLPGGKLDKDENEDDALIREVEEETGVKYNISDFTKELKLTYYQRGYETSEGEIINRKVVTYYYLGKYKGLNKDNIKMSKKELNGNFHTILMNINELKSVLTNEKVIDRRSYYDRELSLVLEEVNI